MSLPPLYSHAAMGTDGRSQIREINLSAMDVCWSNKLFLMRQFGLSQSNFVVKKVDKCIAKFIRTETDILFLIMFIVYTKYFEIDIIFYWTKSLHDMKSDLISVFVDISYEIFVCDIKKYLNVCSLHQIVIHHVLFKIKFSVSKSQ